jgi:ubiquitin-protein ligase
MAENRLRKELFQIIKSPVNHFLIRVDPKNLYEWYFVLYGFDDSSYYKGGRYIGVIICPKDYPFISPVIYMITPNGKCEVNKKIEYKDMNNKGWSPGFGMTNVF